MPVEGHALHCRTLQRNDPPTEKSKDEQHNADADRKMDGVNAGHDPIESPENLGCWRRQREIRPREEVFLEVLAILKPLARQKNDPECGSDAEADKSQRAQLRALRHAAQSSS